jgi:hypothetical protein
MEILNKFKPVANKLIEKLSIMQKPLTVISFVYIALVIILIITWYYAWVWKTIKTGNPDLSSLLQFINTIIGPAAIACVTFIAGLYIDRDHDNIPDGLEKGENIVGSITAKFTGDSSRSGIGPGATTKSTKD